MLSAFGEKIKITTDMECIRGGDHRRLVLEARVDCIKRAMLPDERFVLCGRCAKAVSLKVD